MDVTLARRTNWWICSRFPMKRENKKLLRAEKSMGNFCDETLDISRIYGKMDNVRRVLIIQGNRIAAFPSLRIR